MPWFIDNAALRMAAWLIGEAVVLALEPISRKLDAIMAAVEVEQADLDNVGDTLTALAATLEAIDTTPLAAADETKLNAGLTAVQEAVTKLTSAATPTPAPAPAPDPTPAPGA